MKKVLIFGFGAVGREIQQYLMVNNKNIIVVDSDVEALAEAEKDGCVVYKLDLTKDSNLKLVGVGKDITDIFCVTNNDELNLFVTLTARSLDKNVKILSRAQDTHQKHKLILAGANRAIDINEISANNLFNMLKRPKALDVVEGIVYKENAFFFNTEVRMDEIEIPAGSFLDGEYLISIDLNRDYNILTLGLLDRSVSDKFVFNVGRHNHKISAGNILVVVGRLEMIENLKVALNA